jgi:hypothetical protein
MAAVADTWQDEPGLGPIRRSVTVRRTPEDAFRVFTGRVMDWWPIGTHSVAAAYRDGVTATAVILEPRAGGRFYERMSDGAEASWGTVAEWDPPRRVTIDWKVNPTAPAPTVIEFTFTELEPGVTRVDLEHRGWEALGEEARAEYAGPGGWTTVLPMFGRFADSEVA